MKKIFSLLTILFGLNGYAEVPAGCAFTNAGVVYISPNGNDATAIPGCTEHPYLDPVAANAAASNGWTIIFLPGNHNLSNSIQLLDGETVLINEGAKLVNWVDLSTNRPLFMLTNNVTMIVNGVISDAYATTGPSLEQCSMGVFEKTPDQVGTSVATNLLITGHGTILGASECISIETTNGCSGRIENVHLSSYHSTLNFIHGAHDFAINGITASVLSSSVWSNQQNQVIYCYPDSAAYVSRLLIKDNTLLALARSSSCYYDFHSSNEVTFINNHMANDGTASLISLAAYGSAGPVIHAPLGGVSPADVSPVTYNNHGRLLNYTLSGSRPYPVLPQLSNMFTLPSLGISNMIFFNFNGVPCVAWSGNGGSNTYSAPLSIGPITTNGPRSQ